MTRDEFIDRSIAYVKQQYAGADVVKDGDGVLIAGKYRKVALECNCGESICQGWAMIPDDPVLIDHHMRFSSPLRPVSDA